MGRVYMSKQLKIVTFGKFQVSDEENACTEATNSKSKIWSVLKYLIVFNGKPVPTETLVETLWSGEEYDDPAKILRDIIYRLRKTLVSCFGEQSYIIFDQGNYVWNQEINCWIDYQEFEKLLDSARDETKTFPERIALYNAAIDLYNGPFLGNSAVEIWTLRFTDHYRRLLLQAVGELADLYEADYLLDDIIELYNKVIASEPYEEPLYVRQIQTLINNGEYTRARQQYRFFERILMREFGAKPSRSLERLSYEIERATANQTGSFEEVTKLLESDNNKQGAVFCGPETFRQIYVIEKRSEERLNFPVYLVLVTFSPKTDINESGKDSELKSAMKTLRHILVQSLRRGDIISQYSKCQFILMLIVENNNGGQQAMRRMKHLFESKYGKDKGEITYSLSQIGKGGSSLENIEKIT